MQDLFTARLWKNVGLAALAAFVGSFAVAVGAADAPIGVDALVSIGVGSAWGALRLAAGMVAAAAGSDFDQ